MKKHILILLFTAVFSYSKAQTNAALAFQNGEYATAKKEIDKYFLKNAEKVATSPKEAIAWLYKGQIYHVIATSEDPELRKLAPENAYEIIIEAYNKAIQLDATKKGEHKEKARSLLDGVWATLYNESISKYQEENGELAIKYCKLAQEIKPNDTTAYVLGGNLGLIFKNYTFAKDCFKKLIELDQKKYEYYKNVYYIISEEEKKPEEAFAFLQEARKAFPNDGFFISQEVNYYITSGKQKEAIDKINEAIVSDPINKALYYFNLGVIYTQLEDFAKAKESFQASLAADENYEGSNYMMGYLLVEEGDKLTKKINNMNLKEYQAIGKKEEAKRDEIYKKSIPYFEKAYKLSKEKDPKLKEQIITLYKKLKMNDKINSLD